MSNNLIECAKSLWKDNDGDSAMQMLIDYLRTEDVVKVVRCKECRMADRSKEKDIEIYACHLWRTPRRPNDFCSEGKPKDEVIE